MKIFAEHGIHLFGLRCWFSCGIRLLLYDYICLLQASSRYCVGRMNVELRKMEWLVNQMFVTEPFLASAVIFSDIFAMQ